MEVSSEMAQQKFQAPDPTGELRKANLALFLLAIQ